MCSHRLSLNHVNPSIQCGEITLVPCVVISVQITHFVWANYTHYRGSFVWRIVAYSVVKSVTLPTKISDDLCEKKLLND